MCWGRETPGEFPVFAGSHRREGGGGDIGGGCVLGKASTVVDVLEKSGADHSSSSVGVGCSRVTLEEGRLLDRSFDLWAAEVHRSLRRSRSRGRVLGTGLVCTGVIITTIVVAVYFTVTSTIHKK